MISLGQNSAVFGLVSYNDPWCIPKRFLSDLDHPPPTCLSGTSTEIPDPLHLEDHPSGCKWLITMVSESPR